MAMKSIIFSVAVAAILAVAFCQDLECYSCGYREDGSGDKTKIPDEYEDIAFCGVDNLNDTEDVPIEHAPPGGCCASFKIEQKDEETGDVHWISRFGAGGDSDETSFNFTCGEVSPTYICKAEHVKYGTFDEDGTVCHCYGNKCNTETPDLMTTTPGDETTTIPGESLCYNCGYMEKADGSMSKIPDQVEDIPFCGENFLNDTLDAPTKALMIGGCCSAFRMKTIQDGETTYINRFGTATDPDEEWFGFECGETKPGYTCKNEHISHANYEEDGEVCHCFESRCNMVIPDLPPSGGSSILGSTFLVFVTAPIVLLLWRV